MTRLIKAEEVGRRLAVSRSRVFEWSRAGIIPPPVKLGARSAGWAEHEIESWLADRLAERQPQPKEQS